MKKIEVLLLVIVLFLLAGCGRNGQETAVFFPKDTRQEHPKFTELNGTIKVIEGEEYWSYDPDYSAFNRNEEVGFYHWSEVEKLLELAEINGFSLYFGVPFDRLNSTTRDIEYSVVYVRAADWDAFWSKVMEVYPDLAPTEIPEPLKKNTLPVMPETDSTPDASQA